MANINRNKLIFVWKNQLLLHDLQLILKLRWIIPFYKSNYFCMSINIEHQNYFEIPKGKI